ncbi:phenylalanine--tRNA ligase subunit beta [Staphylococcus nepalensis]|jgi:phenylalanyl-tRNA synthetase beta chain|uniref:Phenylalanine--tRNA ligase beta subunit n=1 Tax=Staphylococcus nepalensis TaxID=214473 RepID=A0A2T4S7T2_9STAP|nr:phenylalanine--tRNA ligase subunit beta [Staphylococcus nepalensis]MBO1213874.1 phenylalanine--tRNA ligase subunit beta [Staphylococcus nepalensis]MBO1214905.1 phenylalanine--tRNA ligase subunit beta [Staphylococcus nepalensis]MBO1226861.1 phenylalanine--tRNA ligase subunit beta [Staphylococcus nepalensis]MBO1233975.1 phenylalanine--tRNA ligase subunit beta [Staphylococcus nepalensis]MBO1237839.1 phenylalanine--tRNA ligase subunit beta [Staphylococcus nepalensis]
MFISKEWLETFVEINQPVNVLAERITRTGIEVDDIIDYTKDIKNLVVGHIQTKAPHPDADKLSLCQVDIGEAEPVQIVCGAPNVDAGQTVIVATVGGRLPGGVKIKRAKLRGERSEGMICSLQEIGISSNLVPKQFEEGIYNFTSDIKPGTNALKALYLDDQVMEFDLTPNRADALSMVGTAYETAALYNVPMIRPETQSQESTKQATDEMRISVQNKDKVPYYSARIVNDVKIQPSPEWIQMRLIKAGIRPINNVVDISNYVLLEYGQPLHMFDQDQIRSKHIEVRQATTGEKMTTLDNQERALKDSDIVITNGDTPIAIGGVMGGDFSEVTESTTNVVIEGAIFDSVSIRHTSRRLNLRSEASSRFEKGIATEFVDEAVDRACYLLQQYAEGTVLQGRIAEGQLGQFVTPVNITVENVNETIGFNLSPEEIEAVFVRLGFETTREGNSLTVMVPSRRKDITIKEDLIEEIARIYGYDEIPSTLPVFKQVTPGTLTDRQAKTRVVKATLEGAGLNQAINYSLVDKTRATDFALQDRSTISLLMPMSEAHSTLRQSLIPHLIDDVSYNVARSNHHVALYELGRVFFGNEENQLPDEVEYLSGILTGDYTVNTWQNKKEEIDFFVTKGIVDRIAEILDIQFEYEAGEIDGLHPGRTAWVKLNEEIVGFVGELHPQTENNYDLKRTYVFELNYDKLMSVSVGYINYEPIPRFPGVSRDIALVINRATPSAEIVKIIQNYGGDILQHAEVFDVYEGEHVAEDEKSIAIRLAYLDMHQTLTDDKVNGVHNRILEALQAEGATIR